MASRHGPCPYCGSPMRGRKVTNGPNSPTREHVVAKSVGGDRYASENIVTACRRCNNHKGHMSLDTFLEWLVARNDKRARHVADFISRRASPKDKTP